MIYTKNEMKRCVLCSKYLKNQDDKNKVEWLGSRTRYKCSKCDGSCSYSFNCALDIKVACQRQHTRVQDMLLQELKRLSSAGTSCLNCGVDSAALLHNIVLLVRTDAELQSIQFLLRAARDEKDTGI